jgi:hypothetical protein
MTMQVRDLQKVLGAIRDTVSATMDHLGDRLSDEASELADDLAPLRDFAKGWKKMGKASRRAFVDQFLKSAGLVAASAAATKLGLDLAVKNQKQLRKVMLGVADLIGPLEVKAKKRKKKLARKLKKMKK